MANLIFKIENNKSNLSSDVIFKDINYDAIITSAPMPLKRSEDEWKSLLIKENPTTALNEHILTEQNFGSSPARILLNYAEPLDYERELRKWRAEGSCKLSANINIKAVEQAIYNIFTWIPGERILLPEFGSKLRTYLYEGITPYNIEQIKAEVNACILQWEPRVRIKDIVDKSTTDDTEDNTVHLMIVYDIPDLGDNTEYYYDYSYTMSRT